MQKLVSGNVLNVPDARLRKFMQKALQIFAKKNTEISVVKCFKRSQRKALQIFAKKQKLASGNVLNVPDAKKVKFLQKNLCWELFETFPAENV